MKSDDRGGDQVIALDYQAALEALLSLVGRHVEVTVMSSEPLGVVAEFSGELVRGDDVRHTSRAGEGDVLRFAVGAVNSFSVEQRLFRQACWVGEGPGGRGLRLYLGATVVELVGVSAS